MDALRSETGSTTAEYAVGTVAAAGFAGTLYLTCPFLIDLVQTILGLVSLSLLAAEGHPLGFVPW